MGSLGFMTSFVMTLIIRMMPSAQAIVLQTKCDVDNLQPMRDLVRSDFNGIWYQHKRTLPLRTPRAGVSMSTLIQRLTLGQHRDGVGYLRSESWGVFSDNDECVQDVRTYRETAEEPGIFQVERRSHTIKLFVLDTDYNSTAALVMTSKRNGRDTYSRKATGIVLYLRDPSMTPAVSVLSRVQAACGPRFSHPFFQFTIPNDRQCSSFDA